MTRFKITTRMNLLILVLSVICIISFLGCIGDSTDTQTDESDTPSNNDTGLTGVDQAVEENEMNRIDEDNEKETADAENGDDEEITDTDSTDEPFTPTQEKPLAPSAEPAEGSDEVPVGELALVVSLSGVDEPVTLTDGISIHVADSLDIQCTIVNNTAEAQSIVFANSQKLDALFTDAAGNVVYQWSRGIRFAQVVNSLDITPGQTWPHEITVPVSEDGLSPGIYNITVMVTGTPELSVAASDVEISI